MCGEQNGFCSPDASTMGSPPRVRGTAHNPTSQSAPERITPACAGNRTSCLRYSPRIKDHPRVCGEQGRGAGKDGFIAGSPPRVRGTACCSGQARGVFGITPACAGNRPWPAPETGPGADHPRVCGEQTKKSPSFLHSFLSDQENSFSLKYNCSISSQSFCARWTSLQGSSKCFAKVDS